MRTYLPTHFKFCSVNEQIVSRESRSMPDAIHGIMQLLQYTLRWSCVTKYIH